MKVKTEIDITISAKAVLRDDTLKLAVSGSMPYGERAANATVDTGFSEQIYKAFEDAFDLLLAETKDLIVIKTQAAHGDALTVAARMGEI